MRLEPRALIIIMTNNNEARASNNNNNCEASLRLHSNMLHNQESWTIRLGMISPWTLCFAGKKHGSPLTSPSCDLNESSFDEDSISGKIGLICKMLFQAFRQDEGIVQHCITRSLMCWNCWYQSCDKQNRIRLPYFFSTWKKSFFVFRHGCSILIFLHKLWTIIFL